MGDNCIELKKFCINFEYLGILFVYKFRKYTNFRERYIFLLLLINNFNISNFTEI